MKDLILIIGEEKYFFDTIEEVIQMLLGKKNKDYFHLTEKEKLNRRYLKAYINCRPKRIRIAHTQYGIIREDNTIINREINIEKDFIIDDDITYVLSLLKENIIYILEEMKSNILAKYIDKTNLNNNYIIINNFAIEILKKYLENKYKSKE